MTRDLSRLVQKRWWVQLLEPKPTTYWALFWLGVGICGLGVVLGICFENPGLAPDFATVALALSFILLMLTRGTARKVLHDPLDYPSLSPEPLDVRLASAADALQAARYAEPTLVRAMVDCLLELEVNREAMLAREKAQKARDLARQRDTLIAALAKSKASAVRVQLDTRLALQIARRNNAALSAHFGALQKETWPVVALSLIATLLAAIGDTIVQAFI